MVTRYPLRPADLRAFFTGIDRALQTLQTRPQESCRTMAPRVQIDAARFCNALGDGIRLVPPTDWKEGGRHDTDPHPEGRRAEADLEARVAQPPGQAGAELGLIKRLPVLV